MILTNDLVQIRLLEAESILRELMSKTIPEESPRLNLLYGLMIAMREYSASGNAIPGYSGLGLQETFALAEKVIKNHGATERGIAIASYKAIAESIVIGS